MWAKNKHSGFTIVELLIVIVVIAILAAITIIAYNSIQIRARDNIRNSASTNIRKALELYKADKGTYPLGGYFESTNSTWTTLSNTLRPYTGGDLPKDPVNDANHFFRYLGTSGTSYQCSDGSKGDFYVLWFIGYEQSGNIPISSQSFSCPQAGWSSGGIYAVWQAWQH